MKKLWILFLGVVLMVVSFGLFGCGESNQESAQTTKPAKEETVAELLAKGSNLPGFYSDVVITSQEGTISGKIWVSGKSMKSEINIEDQKIITILDSNANVAYMYNPEQNMAIKIPVDKAKSDTPDRFARDVDTAKVTVLETTTYEGVRCKILSVQEDKEQTKLWIREDYGIPLRVETTDVNNDKMVIEYKNMKIGSQPADIFKLPAGVEVCEVGM